MNVAILASYVVPVSEPGADVNPYAVIGHLAQEVSGQLRLQAGDLILFTRPTPEGGDLRLLGGSCEDEEEE